MKFRRQAENIVLVPMKTVFDYKKKSESERLCPIGHSDALRCCCVLSYMHSVASSYKILSILWGTENKFRPFPIRFGILQQPWLPKFSWFLLSIIRSHGLGNSVSTMNDDIREEDFVANTDSPLSTDPIGFFDICDTKYQFKCS